MIDCGGEMKERNSEELKRNRDNATYQACYKKQGFSNEWYWSGMAKNSSSAWLVSFKDGDDNWYKKTGTDYVLCVSGQ